MEAYHILERIGEGSFGKVYRGRRKYSGHVVALKFVTKRGKNAKELQSLRDEISILRRLNHCNIIAMLDSFETDGEFCMVTEYAQGDLFQILEDDRQLPEDEIRKIAIQLTQALHVLHSNRIIHRDMKPQNILIGSKQQIKLCDFGFARAISHNSSLLTSIKGTPLYMAPELVRQQPYNYTVDLWSLGVILYELAVGRPPFYTDRIVSLIEMIVREPVRYPPTLSSAFHSFLAGLLNKDPSKRMTWPEILAHEFVVETPEQQHARRVLESQVRALPRFFCESNHESASEVKPSIERLRTSGEWKICDPETGRQIRDDDLTATASASIGTSQASSAKVLEPRLPSAAGALKHRPTERSAAVNAPSASTIRFVDEWRACERSLDAVRGANVLEHDAFVRALVTLESAVHGVRDSTPLQTALVSLMQTQYRALASVYKSIENARGVSHAVATARASTHRVLTTLVSECSSTGSDMSESVSDVIYHIVRCCMLFTTIVNASGSSDSDKDSATAATSYREICRSDVKAVTMVLTLRGAVLYSAHSKTLKWLGAMLDRSKDLTLFLEQVHPSGVIETLCNVLHASGAARSLSGRASKSARDLALYAAFALSTFVQPDGESWGPLQPFPIVALQSASVSSSSVAPSSPEPPAHAKDLKHLFRLRSKVHFEVISQLLKSGLSELLALLSNELTDRASKRRRRNNNSGGGGGGDTDGDDESGGDDDNDDDDDQSSVCCILKVLYHTCRSSVPLTRKLPQTQIADRKGGSATHDVVSVLLDGVAANALHRIELYFAVELFAVILHRNVLRADEVWRCARALYALFIVATDVALLSALSNFFANAVESASVDELVNRSHDNTDDNELLHLLTRGLLAPRAADAVFRLLAHEPFAQLHASVQRAQLQMLVCYNTRAQGLIDAGVVLLLRVAAKAGKQSAPPSATQSVEMMQFLAAFERDDVWVTLQQLLARGGSDLLSPWGLFCCLKLLRVVRELTCHDARIEASMNDRVVPLVVHLLALAHITELFHWPDAVGGGSNAVKALVHAIVKVLGIPFMHGVRDELLVCTQEVLYDAACVHELLGVLQFVVATKALTLEAAVLELPVSFLSRLVTSSEHFGAQFVAADGLRVVKDCGLLTSTSSPSLLIDTVLIVSQLARSDPANCDPIRDANVLRELLLLLGHSEPMVRAKVLNCVGNLCRHSTLFYAPFVEPLDDTTTLLDGVIDALGDVDSYVRRFACFAIGNAAFHSNALYNALRPAIPLLVANLRDREEKTRSNAGGALGNLVRNSDELCAALCASDAPYALFACAMVDPSVVARRIELFSLGNFCVYAQCFDAIVAAEPAFVSRLEQLYDAVESDEVSKKNIRRILAKVDALSSYAAVTPARPIGLDMLLRAFAMRVALVFVITCVHSALFVALSDVILPPRADRVVLLRGSEPGYMQPRMYMGVQPSPVKCPRGKYRPPNAGITISECVKCPRGVYGDSPGLTSSDCTAKCPKGTYNDRPGGTSILDCSPCPPGTFGSATGLTTRACSGPCPYGKYSLRYGLQSVSECEDCPVNYRGPNGRRGNNPFHGREGGYPCDRYSDGKTSLTGRDANIMAVREAYLANPRLPRRNAVNKNTFDDE